MKTRRKGNRHGCDTLSVGLKFFLTPDSRVFFSVFCEDGGGGSECQSTIVLPTHPFRFVQKTFSN